MAGRDRSGRLAAAVRIPTGPPGRGLPVAGAPLPRSIGRHYRPGAPRVDPGRPFPGPTTSARVPRGRASSQPARIAAMRRSRFDAGSGPRSSTPAAAGGWRGPRAAIEAVEPAPRVAGGGAPRGEASQARQGDEAGQESPMRPVGSSRVGPGRREVRRPGLGRPPRRTWWRHGPARAASRRPGAAIDPRAREIRPELPCRPVAEDGPSARAGGLGDGPGAGHRPRPPPNPPNAASGPGAACFARPARSRSLRS
ncbi:hypothetical protein OJF2_05700 [Aquisphaera giovannonii]|uniref:Uncharacterized protein n=1 Tax=Aquisphaera giovannonii TaxID=406548 RepID=A0A5B9VW70_9BACT|nr:hypothetical protein OJF2_05700 [Aquisphaera giovannonii]